MLSPLDFSLDGGPCVTVLSSTSAQLSAGPGDASPGADAVTSPLATGSRYAESEPILAKVRATYALLADVATGRAQVALDPAAGLSEDTVTRRWLDDFLARERGLSLGSDFPPLLRRPDVDAPRAWPAGAEIVTDPFTSGEAAAWEQVHGELFADVLNPDAEDVRFATAGPEEVACIQQAASLVAAVAPDLFAAVLPHTSIIYLVEGADAFESASDRRLPRAVYLSRAACRDVVRTAEALLHESTHQKLYDLQLLYTLYASSYEPRTAPTVHPTWHPADAAWSIDRTVAASHVYVHLTAFLERLEAAVPPGYSAAAIRRTAEQARARAEMLLGGLAPFTDSQLNLNGQAFVAWLAATHHHTVQQPSKGHHD